MEYKSSSGYDGISNKMLKHIKKQISKPLTLIINQMLDSGIFPGGLKISKIISIFKKGDVNSLNNCCRLSPRFLSALYMISLMPILIIITYYMKNSMDSAQSIRLSCQQ